MALIESSSAGMRYRAKPMPPTARTSRMTAAAADPDRQAAGRLSTAMARNHPSPRAATGMPISIDCELVVTLAQLMAPDPPQARIEGVVEWAAVRVAATPTAATATTTPRT